MNKSKIADNLAWGIFDLIMLIALGGILLLTPLWIAMKARDKAIYGKGNEELA